jgi:hypothetical protein
LDDKVSGRTFAVMKKWSLIMVLLVLLLISSDAVFSQCSICTKSAQQMGERPAKALNAGILYLAAMPFLIFTYIGYRWWKSQKSDAGSD